ncbi:MAG TPA: VanZ family protein [Anaerolineales bacterium]|nr:VanZ family protein [Anaerolineales bacterium]
MKLTAFFYTLFIIALIILADTGRLPPFLRAAYDFPGGDKAGHLILFGLLNLILSLTFLRSLRNADPQRVAVSIGLILALFLLAEEVSQIYIPRRTFNILDLLAGWLGLIIGGSMAWMIHKRGQP